MGEYYNWVNVDKREYLCPNNFGYGNKLHESMHKDSLTITALHVLLNDEWKGNRVVWLGDECDEVTPDSDYEIIRYLYSQIKEHHSRDDYFDMICEEYKNISCLFKSAEKVVRNEVRIYLESLKEENTGYQMRNEYGIDVNNPFENMFHKSGRRFKYTVNHTKRVYYSLDETRILEQNNNERKDLDPLPLLMGFGRSTDSGLWLSDIIGVADQPPEGYELLEEIYLDW